MTAGGQSLVKIVEIAVLVLWVAAKVEARVKLDVTGGEGVEMGVVSTFRGEAGAF